MSEHPPSRHREHDDASENTGSGDPARQGAISEAQLRVIKDTSTVWLWEQDAQYRFTLDLRGRDGAAEEGQVIGIRRWESDGQPLQGTWEDHKRVLEAKLPFRDFEFRVGKGSDTRYISTTGVPVYAPDGTFTGYRGTAMNVTELRNARDASERAQSFLRLANRLGRVAAWRIDLPGKQPDWSPEFLELLDFEAGASPTFEQVFAMSRRRQQAQLVRAWDACVHDGTPFDLEVRAFSVSGRAMWLRLLGEAARDNHGAVVSIQGAAQDITKSKDDRERLRHMGEQLAAANAELIARVRDRTRELELVNAELQGFAHALAHDLKQPIVAVQWFSTALDHAIAQGDLAQAAHLSGRINAAGHRMQDYVDALLSLAETSQAPLTLAEVDLGAIAEAVLDDLAARDASRRLVRDVQPGMVVRADRRLLRMLLENLLGNAWKFTAGREVVQVSVTARTGDEGETIYCVQDNGAGFDMAHAGKLFGNFQRLHASSEFEGTGVGLANVQRIVLRHGGRIWGESRVGEGARFSFTLADTAAPAAPAPDGEDPRDAA